MRTDKHHGNYNILTGSKADSIYILQHRILRTFGWLDYIILNIDQYTDTGFIALYIT